MDDQQIRETLIELVPGGLDGPHVAGARDHGGEIYLVVGMFELRDGKIIRETRYYPQPFEPPAWRSQWVERIADA